MTREDLRWAVATAISVLLCVLAAPLSLLAWGLSCLDTGS